MSSTEPPMSSSNHQLRQTTPQVIHPHHFFEKHLPFLSAMKSDDGTVPLCLSAVFSTCAELRDHVPAPNLFVSIYAYCRSVVEVNIMLLGDGGVGKSTFVRQFFSENERIDKESSADLLAKTKQQQSHNAMAWSTLSGGSDGSTHPHNTNASLDCAQCHHCQCQYCTGDTQSARSSSDCTTATATDAASDTAATAHATPSRAEHYCCSTTRCPYYFHPPCMSVTEVQEHCDRASKYIVSIGPTITHIRLDCQDARHCNSSNSNTPPRAKLRLKITEPSLNGVAQSNIIPTDIDAVLIMFDVTSRITYRNVPHYWRLFTGTQIADGLPVFLVANKVDISNDLRKVKTKDVTFARKKDLPYFEVSARANYGIAELVQEAVKKALVYSQHRSRRSLTQPIKPSFLIANQAAVGNGVDKKEDEKTTEEIDTAIDAEKKQEDEKPEEEGSLLDDSQTLSASPFRALVLEPLWVKPSSVAMSKEQKRNVILTLQQGLPEPADYV